MKIQTLPSGLQVVPSVYPGFPATQTLNQALRPYPQWGGVPPFLGPPLGDTWYDSLQVKVTKRYSHGLDVQYSFAWQKELVLGASNDTSYLVSGYPRINDVFNYAQNKQLNPFSRPLVSIISFNYHTPGIPGDSKGMKVVSHVRQGLGGGRCVALPERPVDSDARFQQQLPEPVGRRSRQQPRDLGWRRDLPEQGSRTAFVPARSELPLFRSDQATGAEPGGVDRCSGQASSALPRLSTTTSAGSGNRLNR